MLGDQLLQVGGLTFVEDGVEPYLFETVVGVVVDCLLHQLWCDTHDGVAVQQVFAVLQFDLDSIFDHRVGCIDGGGSDLVLFLYGFEDVGKERQVGVELVTCDELDHITRTGDFVSEQIDVAEAKEEVDPLQVHACHGTKQHLVRRSAVDIACELFGNLLVLAVERGIVFVEVEDLVGVAAGIEQYGITLGVVDLLHDLQREDSFDQTVVRQPSEVAEVLLLCGVVEAQLGEGHLVDRLFVIGKVFEVLLLCRGVDFAWKPGIGVHQVVNVAVPAVAGTVEIDEACRCSAKDLFIEDLFAVGVVVVYDIHGPSSFIGIGIPLYLDF